MPCPSTSVNVSLDGVVSRRTLTENVVIRCFHIDIIRDCTLDSDRRQARRIDPLKELSSG